MIIGGSGLFGVNWALRKRYAQDIYLCTNKRKVEIEGTKTIINRYGDQSSYEELIDMIKPNIVVNAAAVTNIEICEKNKRAAYETNAELAESLAKITMKKGVKFVQISTDQLFSGQKKLMDEKDIVSPVNTV